jgi:hypothetical protein
VSGESCAGFSTDQHNKASPGLYARQFKGLEKRARLLSVRNMQRPVSAAVSVGTPFVRLRLFKVGEAVGIAPAARAF